MNREDKHIKENFIGCFFVFFVFHTTISTKHEKSSLAAYLSILDECALLTDLQKYARDDARKRGSVPKYQVYNNVLLRRPIKAIRSLPTGRTQNFGDDG